MEVNHLVRVRIISLTGIAGNVPLLLKRLKIFWCNICSSLLKICGIVVLLAIKRTLPHILKHCLT